MGTPQHELDTALGLVLEISILLEEDMSRAFVELGLTSSRMRLLWVLHQHGPRTQREIADELGVTARNVTGLVDALVETGFVRREPHPTDRRATVVSPTDHGAEVLAGVEASRVELTHQLFGDLDTEHFQALSGGLRELASRIRTLVAEAAV